MPRKLLFLISPRLLPFLAGGGTATLLHWLVMLGLIQLQQDPRLATAGGATAGLLLNYVLQYHFIYRSELPHSTSFPRYLTASAFGWILNLTLFALLLPITNQVWLSQLLATAAVTSVSFFCSERLVFNESSITARR